MKIEDLVPLTNGLSVTACGQTLVCDRARIRPVREDAIDVKFSIAGTDLVPRFRLGRKRVLEATTDEVARMVRLVVRAVAPAFWVFLLGTVLAMVGGALGNVLLPSHHTGLPKDSVAAVTQVFTMDRRVLLNLVGAVPNHLLRRIEDGLRLVLDL